MIGDRVRWAHDNFADRGGIVRALTRANGTWHALVQRADGSYHDELVENLVVDEPGTPIDSEAAAAAIDRLRSYLSRNDLVTGEIVSPGDAAIELLRQFEAELAAVGEARDVAVVERDEAVSRLTGAYDVVKAERDKARSEAVELALECQGLKAQRDAALARADELAVELEAAKKAKQRNRGPERIG